MEKITDCFKTGKYSILVLKNALPLKKINFAKVDGKTYKITIPFDIPNSIAIESDENFTGKTIELV